MTRKIKSVYVLRTCDADLRAYGGFQWPESGPVLAPDWQPTKYCGNGLHGLLWGAGEANHLSTDADAKWLVVEINSANLIDLDGKVKFPTGNVVFCGDRLGAVEDILARGADPATLVYHTLTGGDDSTLIFKWWNGHKYRLAVGEVGEGGIKKDVPYFVKNGAITKKV